jgi:hypothetical protein
MTHIPKAFTRIIDTTEAHLAGFAHKHALEHRSASIEHAGGTNWLLRTMLTRETHSLETQDMGAFVFDVTSIKLVLARRIVDYQMLRIDLNDEWVEYTYRTGGCEEAGIERLQLADLDRPGIMVLFGPGRTAMIDGNHRLVRSWREGRATYEMALVPIKEIAFFVCRPGAEDGLMERAKILEEELGRL